MCSLHYEKFPDGSVKCIEEEIPFELPQGWAWSRLGLLCPYGECINVDSNNISNEDWILDLEDIEKDTGKILSFITKSERTTKSTKHKFDKGQLLYSKLRPYLNKVLIAPRDGYCTSEIIPLTFWGGIVPQYMQAYMMSDTFLAYVNLIAYGLKMPRLGTNDGLKALIAIPPINEQKRISNRINKILPYIELIRFEQDSLSILIQQAKSKILDLAIRGKLVPQDPNDESASSLLERIRAEKEELIRQGKIKRDKKESVIFRGEDNSYYLKSGDLTKSIDDWGLDDIPDNWDICCLGELCDYGNCVSVDTSTIKDNAWILDLEDIEKDTGKVLAKIYKSDRNSASTKHRFKKGQVLYSKLRPYLNKVVIADEDGYCTSEIIPLELNPTITPDYMRYYLMSNTFLRYANHCSYGVKMPRLGTADGKKL